MIFGLSQGAHGPGRGNFSYKVEGFFEFTDIFLGSLSCNSRPCRAGFFLPGGPDRSKDLKTEDLWYSLPEIRVPKGNRVLLGNELRRRNLIGPSTLRRKENSPPFDISCRKVLSVGCLCSLLCVFFQNLSAWKTFESYSPVGAPDAYNLSLVSR